MLTAALLALLIPAASQDCGLVLELKPSPVRMNQRWNVAVSATLINRGTRTITLVMPGDGSLLGSRTPVITWSYDSAVEPSGGFCGNINRLKPGEVFTVAVGESRDLGPWIRPSIRRSPPHFRATLVYSQ